MHKFIPLYLTVGFYLNFLYFAESKFAIGIPRVLPSRVKLVRLWLHEILTFSGCCLCYISFNVHIATKISTLGKTRAPYWKFLCSNFVNKIH